METNSSPPTSFLIDTRHRDGHEVKHAVRTAGWQRSIFRSRKACLVQRSSRDQPSTWSSSTSSDDRARSANPPRPPERGSPVEARDIGSSRAAVRSSALIFMRPQRDLDTKSVNRRHTALNECPSRTVANYALVNARPQHARPPTQTAVFVVLVFAFALAAVACNTFDEPYAVPVINDTHQPVIVAVCESYDCSKTADDWTVRPSKQSFANVEAGAGYNSEIVFDAHKHVIGCLPLRFSHRPTRSLSVRVSQALPCGSGGGAQAANNEDWPDPKL